LKAPKADVCELAVASNAPPLRDEEVIAKTTVELPPPMAGGSGSQTADQPVSPFTSTGHLILMFQW
jgi:hypothetical protein